MLPPSSSRRAYYYSLFSGEPSEQPDVMALFQVGSNGAGDGLCEYAIGDSVPQKVQNGRLIWDPGHDIKSADPFFSVAPVRLDLSPGGCRWAVGTSAFVHAAPAAYKSIQKVQIVAHTGNHTPDRLVQWDWIEISFVSADGRRNLCQSPCLPKVGGTQALRRAVSAQSPAQAPMSQFCEICAGPDIVQVGVRGQVTLRANHGAQPRPLEPDDLQGRVLVFTSH